jgi:hypothetical protein
MLEREEREQRSNVNSISGTWKSDPFHHCTVTQVTRSSLDERDLWLHKKILQGLIENEGVRRVPIN